VVLACSFKYDGNDFGKDPVYVLAGSMGNEPRSLDEAFRGPHAANWKAALQYEISQLEKLRTWKIVDRPDGKPVIPHSVVFQEKLDANDKVVSRRLRIVAGGHRQTFGVNYTETFSSAAKMPSIRVLFTIAASNDWELHQVDIKSAYLNAELKEEVYMVAPM